VGMNHFVPWSNPKLIVNGILGLAEEWDNFLIWLFKSPIYNLIGEFKSANKSNNMKSRLI
jgi:hypothetical protein